METFLEKLNPQQREAVLHTEGPLLILAGAGSGKTRVITHRIVNLIVNHNIYPYRICALTFTNKAAGEMRERVKQLLPNSGNMVMIKTFHSLGLYILRKYPEKIGLKNGFTVYDVSLQETLLKEIIKDLGIGKTGFNPSQVNSLIQKAKDRFQTWNEFAADSWDHYYKTIAEIYEEYEKRKTDRNSIDFGDLIFKTVQLLQTHPDILEKFNRDWEYIMVDEYQDTNKSQYILTKLLAGTKKNVCVVGDDDQSIYSWRGADIRNILDFEKDYPNAFVVKLEENYRSTGNIIEAASSLIQNNSSRKDKTLFTNQPKGDLIPLTPCQDELEEARIVVEKIKELYRKEKTYLPFAIFYRTNAQSRFFEEALRTSNIPYKIFGGFRFFDRAEIKDLIAYLCVIVNPDDTGSLIRIINTPPRKIGEVTIEKLRMISIQEGKSFFDVMDGNHSEIRAQAKKSLAELKSNLEDLRKMFLNKSLPSHIARSLIVQVGLEEEYKKNDDIESIDRLENMEEFVRAMQEYEEQTENPDLAEYIAQISLLTSEEENAQVTDYITLMTVHNSKGLEFDTVFLTGMDEGTFPHFRNIEKEEEGEHDGIEEERRLCYVAITRARKKLFISYPLVSRKFGNFEYRTPSRFLKEIPENLFAEALRSPTNKRIYSDTPRAKNRKSNPDLDSRKRTNTESSQKEIRVGGTVRHRDYGEGKILEVSGTGDNRKVKIQFGYTYKNFLLAYTPLEIISDKS